jgi:hypothetical protein
VTGSGSGTAATTTRPAGADATGGAAVSNSTTVQVPGTTAGTTGSVTGSGRSTTGTMGASGDSTFCPPGLEKKDNGCMPPGQAKKSGTRTAPTDPTTLNRR